MSSQPIDSHEHRGSGVPAVLERLRGEVRELGQTLWAARGRDELMDTVAAVETLKTTLDALELAAVRELDATSRGQGRRVGLDPGLRHLGRRRPQRHRPAAVRLSAALETPLLAPVAEALGDGWLSTTKAHVIERAIDTLPGDPDLRARAVTFLLDQAKALDATELRKLTHRLLTIVDPDGDDRRAERELDRLERAAHLGRHLTVTEDQCGGAWIKGRCTQRGRGPDQGHPDPAGRTPTRGPPRWSSSERSERTVETLRPGDLSRSRGVVTTDATPVTTAPGCSTPWSRAADGCRPPTCCPPPTARCRG